MRLSTRIGRSRLTRCSCCNEASAVPRAVSGPMSACTTPLSAAVTVRQTPFTARLSPGVNSDASVVRTRRRNPDVVVLSSASVPTASMRPVNITFDECIGSQHFHCWIDQRRQRPAAASEQRNAGGPEADWGDVQLDVVNDAFVARRRVDYRSPLEEDALNIES